MAVNEVNPTMRFKKENGDIDEVYPITKVENIIGLKDKLAGNHLYENGVTSTGTGAAYITAIDGVAALEAGLSFIFVPHVTSTVASPTLNVNNLGAKAIRRPISGSTTATVASYNAGWLSANRPIRVTYNGTYWIADLVKPDVTDFHGSLAATSVSYTGTINGVNVTNVSSAIAQVVAYVDSQIGSALEGSY